MAVNRYHRQMLLPQLGPQGQHALGKARVLLVGCGALGTNIAEQLVRSGVGFLRIADRDIVEITNLQRQVLFDENDAERHWPKALAAAERLGRVNSQVTVEPQVVDVHSHNVSALAKVEGKPIDLILDGTDNVATRYLLNDLAVRERIPWVYAACVGTEGRVMAVRPGATPCLRCVFPEAPAGNELPTCDSAGVLGMAAAMTASLAAVAGLRILLGQFEPAGLISFDAWNARFHRMDLDSQRRSDCPCCGSRRFEFLNSESADALSLCGRDAVQVRGARPIELKSLAELWRAHGLVEETRFFIRCRLDCPTPTTLTAFHDGRLIVQGTRDIGRAKSIYAQFVGA